jgi:hypothetical protein
MRSFHWSGKSASPPLKDVPRTNGESIWRAESRHSENKEVGELRKWDGGSEKTSPSWAASALEKGGGLGLAI